MASIYTVAAMFSNNNHGLQYSKQSSENKEVYKCGRQVNGESTVGEKRPWSSTLGVSAKIA
jgi:hypothetical protein